MNKLLAACMQQEVRYPTVHSKIQAVPNPNNLKPTTLDKMPFSLPVFGLNILLQQIHFMNNWQETDSNDDKVIFKFDLQIVFIIR